MPPIAVAQKRNRLAPCSCQSQAVLRFRCLLCTFHCLHQNNIALSPAAPWEEGFIVLFLCGGWGRMEAGGRYKATPHNSKCRYGERGAADAKPKAQIILDVLSSILATQMPCRTPSRSEALRSATAACGGSWRGDPPERCLSRQAGIVRCCLSTLRPRRPSSGRACRRPGRHRSGAPGQRACSGWTGQRRPSWPPHRRGRRTTSS